MPLPKDAAKFAEPLDPSDVLPFLVDLTTMLPPGQGVSAITVEPSLESAALGLQVGTGAMAPSQPQPVEVVFWPLVTDNKKTSNSWQNDGTDVALEITVVTDANPPQTLQRSVILTVRER